MDAGRWSSLLDSTLPWIDLKYSESQNVMDIPDPNKTWWDMISQYTSLYTLFWRHRCSCSWPDSWLLPGPRALHKHGCRGSASSTARSPVSFLGSTAKVSETKNHQEPHLWHLVTIQRETRNRLDCSGYCDTTIQHDQHARLELSDGLCICGCCSEGMAKAWWEVMTVPSCPCLTFAR